MKIYIENKLAQFQEEFDAWVKDGNVTKNADGTFSTQCAQWRNKLKNWDALRHYFFMEYLR